MKRNYLIIALLAFPAEAAFSEGNVAIYGIADATFESVRATGATAAATDNPTRQRVSSNSSLVGFRGTENLTGEIDAIFQIESGVNLDSGGNNFATRDSFVGIKGNFGTLRAGFMTAPMRGLGGKTNFIPGSTSIANNIGIMTNVNGRALGFNSRLANAIIYTTPDLGGFVTSFAYGANEGKTTTKNDPTYGLGIEFARSGIYVGYAFERRKDKEVLALPPSADTNHRLAVRYTFGNTKIGVGFDREESKGIFGTDTGSVARDAFSISLSHTIGNHEFLFHYAKARRLRCKGSANSGECAPDNIPDTGAVQFSPAYHYFFSKRTMFQAYISRIRNDAQAKYDFDTNPIISTLAARSAGADPTGIGFGIRHAF